jgi:hypothetical protein
LPDLTFCPGTALPGAGGEGDERLLVGVLGQIRPGVTRRASPPIGILFRQTTPLAQVGRRLPPPLGPIRRLALLL